MPLEDVAVQIKSLIKALAPGASNLVVGPLSLKEAVHYFVLVVSHDIDCLLRKYSDFVETGCYL